MYGTIAHFRLRPGVREEFIQVMDSFGDDIIPGWKADYYFQMDRDSNEFFLVAIFQDQETYAANADSPQQHERYLRFRSFLIDDPQWSDGAIVSATGPSA